MMFDASSLTLGRRSALSFAVSSVVIVILGLATGWRAAEWLALVVGLWVGLFLEVRGISLTY